MIPRAKALAAALGVCLIFTAPPVAQASTPVWHADSLSFPTDLAPGSTGHIEAFVANLAVDAPSAGVVKVIDTLPPGLTATAAGEAHENLGTPASNYWHCSIKNQVVTCTSDPTTLPSIKHLDYGGLSTGAAAEGGAPPISIAVTVDPLAEPGVLENSVKVSGGAAASAFSAIEPVTISPGPAPFGVQSLAFSAFDRDGFPAVQAGSHPYEQTTRFALNDVTPAPGGDASSFAPVEQAKDVEFVLPDGFVGNPLATPRCSRAQFDARLGSDGLPTCPVDTQIGVETVTAGDPNFTFLIPVYNLVPPANMPAQFGFAYGQKIGLIGASVGPGPGYRLTVAARNLNEVSILNSTLTLWGVPADPSHDAERGHCLEEIAGNCHSDGVSKPFLTMPTSCGEAFGTAMAVDSWRHPGVFAHAGFETRDAEGNQLPTTGCSALDFKPEIEARPTTNLADSPSGLDFHLHIPQNEDPEGLAESHLKDAVVTLPEGLNVNPSSADGLAGCSEAQIGLDNTEAPSCPEASKLGTVEVETPLLEEPLTGAVYLASPNANPSHSLLAGYIVAAGSGVLVKLPGKFETDPNTGRITASFKENPQLPFEDFKLHFFGGARGALRTPPTCGAFETTSDLTPWSTPELPDAEPSDSFEVSQGPGAGACIKSQAEEPHKPSFAAGTLNPTAGSYSPFLLKLARADGSQELKGIDTTLPPGLSGKLAGIPYCPEAALEAAKAKSGSEERQSPSCPLSSQVGTVSVGAGAGPNPIYVQGHAYLAPPYKGAPLSLAIITPALAGPFDLGTVVVKTALYVDPESARIHAVSDPIPTILEGIPLDLRSVALQMDRPDFTLNPTSCDETAVSASALSVLDQSAPLSDRFQVGGCGALGFKPKLSFRLKGATKRGDHPAFTATLKARPGDANIARAEVTLPHSEFLDQGHIKTVCTRVQFAADQCPAGSVYGFAKAVTPLLDQPLEGPVYLRSSSHELPDLVASLGGQLNIVLDGHVDSSAKGGIRNTFEAVPDAPVTKFTLSMQGGKKGLLENSRDLCKSSPPALVSLEAQNGKVDDFSQPLANDCKKQQKRHKHKKRGARHRKHHG